MPLQEQSPATVIAALYIEALRQGTPLWFRVISGSMQPLFHVGDEVYIEPIQARDIQRGDIAAFETSEGLVIHRIVARQENGSHIRLLQMADVVLRPSWIDEHAVVGRVVAIRRENSQVSLQHPIAKWYARAIANIRFQLYSWKKFNLVRMALRVCSHIVLTSGCWCIYHYCHREQK